MTWRDDLAVLRRRDVRVFVSARFVSLLGSSIAPIALVFAVLDVADSASAVGIVLAARSIPNVIFLLIGGVIADRLPRHLVLVVDALTFLLAAFLLARLALPRIERVRTSVLHDLRVGWGEFVSRQWVWVIVLAFAVLNMIFTACYNTLGPVIADDTFGRAGWGAVSACFGAGLILGGVLMIRVKPRYPLRVGMLGVLLTAPIFFCLALVPNVVVVAAAAFVVGIGFEMFGITWETALGQQIPLDKLSRVASYDMLGSFIANPVGQLAVGYVAAVISAKAVELYGATLHIVVVLAALAVPSVWKLQRQTD
ncbi:putative MFS family arabinose efflux permease [Kribbella amoyensis]|uniref:Putative MFS family arabinose efflux permease n=1 Tax=Kribbella amoyensis TaxID=996641 RepID=A0A561B7I5_9ACTN|nr:MFS transporter [Kribbella amoyensis]TWD74911.1 putative MFS family arabinose efflux permease [Kribbella amoyensis]